MDLFRPVDLYCERQGPEFWAEPLNFLSNGAFLIAAAYFCLRHWRQVSRHWQLQLLLALLTAVGIGSGLFHSFAQLWSQLADVIPIGLLVVFYIICYYRYVESWGPAKVLFGVLVFLVMTAVFALAVPKGWFNGSQTYFPVLINLLFMGKTHQDSNARPLVFAAAATFFLALMARSVDMAMCEVLSVGTHYVWHTLCAITIYLMLTLLIRDRAFRGDVGQSN